MDGDRDLQSRRRRTKAGGSLAIARGAERSEDVISLSAQPERTT